MNIMNLGKCFFSTILFIHFGTPILRDIIPSHTFYHYEDWLALAGMYAIVILTALPMITFLIKSPRVVGKNNRVLFFLALSGMVLQILSLNYFWLNHVVMYVFMAFIISIVGVVAIFIGKNCGTYSANANPSVLENTHNNLYTIIDNHSSTLLKNFGSNTKLLEGTSKPNSHIGEPFPASFLSAATGNDCIRHDGLGILINPSTGLPMVGGMSGIDVQGNSWGTNNNDVSNMYDPSRDY